MKADDEFIRIEGVRHRGGRVEKSPIDGVVDISEHD
jgi:hypothetical protein